MIVVAHDVMKIVGSITTRVDVVFTGNSGKNHDTKVESILQCIWWGGEVTD